MQADLSTDQVPNGAAAAVTPVRDLVEQAVRAALRQVLSPALAGTDPLVRRSGHADFQSNVAMAVAAAAGTAPATLAAALRDALDGPTLTAAVSGPGFLNLRVPDETLWHLVAARAAHPRFGVGTPAAGSRVVVDYSAPNIAKEMHVGHLRTTVIGDALARVLDFLGATVLRQNHLGDWGTQFGMLIQYLVEHPDLAWRDDAERDDPADAIATLSVCYRAANARFDTDEAFAGRARRRVVALQAGDPATLAVWRDLIAVSQRSFQALYDRLGVLLTPADAVGESSYNPQLAAVVGELVAAGIAVPSDGALCVFADDVTGPDGTPVPLIVRKSDGGFGYAVTDLAALRHRVLTLGADRILYVVDARQATHFRMVFATARRAGWLPARVEAVHVPFGTVLGTDGRPYRTRSGQTVPLGGLLDAAVAAARAVVLAKNPGLAPATAEQIAQAVGIGAVKIADLSTSRVKDYVFDPDRMVSLSGDTGVYLQYAHARMRSILARVPDAHLATVDPALPLHPTERALALHLDGFGDALAQTADSAEPHRLCGYLFTLAKAFTEFHGACHVLRADTPGQRGNRVVLCRLTADTLATGLGLLGVAAPDRL